MTPANTGEERNEQRGSVDERAEIRLHETSSIEQRPDRREVSPVRRARFETRDREDEHDFAELGLAGTDEPGRSALEPDRLGCDETTSMSPSIPPLKLPLAPGKVDRHRGASDQPTS